MSRIEAFTKISIVEIPIVYGHTRELDLFLGSVCESVMSKLKTPQQKKLASLKRDGRNVYGENDKASRRLVPRAKQTGQQALRRAGKQPLLNPSQLLDVDAASMAESEVRAATIKLGRKRFKKKPDAPLGAVLRARGKPFIPAWQGGDRLGEYREVLDSKKRSIDRS